MTSEYRKKLKPLLQMFSVVTPCKSQNQEISIIWIKMDIPQSGKQTLLKWGNDLHNTFAVGIFYAKSKNFG